MKLVKTITAGLFTACIVGEAAIAAHPPLDRPTPPPCCADGICYPNAPTWGWYGTRWRRWPMEELQPTPAATTPADKLGPDIQPYETPPAEEEDRRAPPPTKPAAEEGAEGGAEAPGTAPLAPPPGGGSESPSTAPLTPAPAAPSIVPPPTKMPWENGDEPTGDWDPPPAPPTTTTVTIDRAPAARTPNRFEPAQPNRPAVWPRAVPNNDPPPTLPVALANATY